MGRGTASAPPSRRSPSGACSSCRPPCSSSCSAAA